MPTVAERLLWQLSNMYQAGLPGMYLPDGFTARRQVATSISESSGMVIFTSSALSVVPYSVTLPEEAGI